MKRDKEKDEKIEEQVSSEINQIEEMAQKNGELLQDLQRTRADFENFRKQVEIQKENEKKATKLATIYKILPLIDDIDRAIGTYEELKPLEKSLEKTLNELNLAKIDSSEGTEFNPELHEAVFAEGDGEKEIISETLRVGYYYEGEVLREAMVKVKKVSEES